MNDGAAAVVASKPPMLYVTWDMMEVMRMQRCKEELHVHFVQWFILTLRAVIVGAFARMVQNHLHMEPPEFNMEQNVV